jgi:putative aldouronate transport system permease protein
MNTLKKSFLRDRQLLIMLVPALLLVLLFSYIPMSGLLMAFKNYVATKGILGSDWVGFRHFERFFSSMFFERLMRNTVVLSVLTLAFGLPFPILFALLLNEVRHSKYRKLVQTISYMPHFLSLVVVVAIIQIFFEPVGLVNRALSATGIPTTPFTSDPKWFRALYVGSEIWQNMGWNSIIFIAAIAGVNPNLYEAAAIDGASRFKRMLYVTLPGITPTIIVVFIMNCGWLMSIGYEKIILMYAPETYDTADVISTYVYRQGILNAQFSFATAIGLFNSMINMAILVGANLASAKLTDTSLF